MATDRGVQYVHGLAALGYALAGKVPVLSLEMRAKTPFFPHVGDTPPEDRGCRRHARDEQTRDPLCGVGLASRNLCSRVDDNP